MLSLAFWHTHLKSMQPSLIWPTLARSMRMECSSSSKGVVPKRLPGNEYTERTTDPGDGLAGHRPTIQVVPRWGHGVHVPRLDRAVEPGDTRQEARYITGWTSSLNLASSSTLLPNLISRLRAREASAGTIELPAISRTASDTPRSVSVRLPRGPQQQGRSLGFVRAVILLRLVSIDRSANAILLR